MRPVFKCYQLASSNNTKDRTCFFVFHVLASPGCLHLDALSALLREHLKPEGRKEKLDQMTGKHEASYRST